LFNRNRTMFLANGHIPGSKLMKMLCGSLGPLAEHKAKAAERGEKQRKAGK